MNKTVFITGSSGFIGSNLAKRILPRNIKSFMHEKKRYTSH